MPSGVAVRTGSSASAIAPRQPRTRGFVRLAAQAGLRKPLLNAVKLGIGACVAVVCKYLFYLIIFCNAPAAE